MQGSVLWHWDQTDLEECAGIVTVPVITGDAAALIL